MGRERCRLAEAPVRMRRREEEEDRRREEEEDKRGEREAVRLQPWLIASLEFD